MPDSKTPLNENEKPEVEGPSFLERAIADGKKPSLPISKTQTFPAFMALDLPAPSWIVPHLIPASSLVFFAGEPGSYKTFLALKIACRLIEGEHLFDMVEAVGALDDTIVEPLPPVNILFVEEEMNASQVQLRVRRMQRAKPKSEGHIALSTNFKLSVPEDVAALKAFCMENSIKVIFFDPFSSILGAKDENDNAAVSKILDTLRREIIDDMKVGASVVLIHHPAKNARGEGVSIRGAGDIMGKADHAVRFDRSANESKTTVKVIKCRQEDMTQIPVMTVEFRKVFEGETERTEVALTEFTTDRQAPAKKKEADTAAEIRRVMRVELKGRAQRKDVATCMSVAPSNYAFMKAWNKLKEEGIIQYNKDEKDFTLVEKDSGLVPDVHVEAPPRGRVDLDN